MMTIDATYTAETFSAGYDRVFDAGYDAATIKDRETPDDVRNDGTLHSADGCGLWCACCQLVDHLVYERDFVLAVDA